MKNVRWVVIACITAGSVALAQDKGPAPAKAKAEEQALKPYDAGKLKEEAKQVNLSGKAEKGAKAPTAAPATQPLVAGQLYVVFLNNMSNWTATNIKDQAGGYSEIRPPVGKTCERTDARWCIDNKRYAPILTTSCSNAPFKVALRVTHPKGVSGDTTDVQIVPSCNYAGEVVSMMIPDP